MDIDPRQVISLSDGGSNNMGDVSDLTNTNAMFGGDDRFALLFLRVHFSTITAATGAADLAIRVRSRLGVSHDFTLFTINGDQQPGIGADVNFRVPLDELAHWVFQDGDLIVLEWANPSSGNITWGVELGVIPLGSS